MLLMFTHMEVLLQQNTAPPIFAGGLTEAGALVFGPGSKADSISQIGRGLPKLSPEQVSVNNI